MRCGKKVTKIQDIFSRRGCDGGNGQFASLAKQVRKPIFDSHPEQAFFAQRGIRADRAKRRVLCNAIIARLVRFLFELSDYPKTSSNDLV